MVFFSLILIIKIYKLHFFIEVYDVKKFSFSLPASSCPIFVSEDNHC